MKRDENNKGIITLSKRLDREHKGLHTLTIKCYKPSDKSIKNLRKPYDRTVSLIKQSELSSLPQFSEAWRGPGQDSCGGQGWQQPRVCREEPDQGGQGQRPYLHRDREGNISLY